ncbi:MAG: hypothetical protein KBD19_02145 [Candidatus Moranbacteria bacterium]|nr:hypothetical protein [Candidatus Moranbacteria bacterium]
MITAGISGIRSVVKKHRHSLWLKQIRGHVRLLRDGNSGSRLNGALRVTMLLEIRRAFDAGYVLSDFGIGSPDELGAIITNVEQWTFRDADDDRTLFLRIRMTEEQVLLFFRLFLHDLMLKDCEKRTSALLVKRSGADLG